MFDRGERGILGIACGRIRNLACGGLDDAGLGIEDIADAAVGADLAQPPGNLPHHARALADRGEVLVQRKIVQRCRHRDLRFADRGADCGQCVGKRVIGRRLFLRGDALLDAGDRIQHQAGIGIAVALGVFAKEPAAARRLHERFADRRIVLLARLRGASRDRREGECFVSHAKTLGANHCAVCHNDQHERAPNRN